MNNLFIFWDLIGTAVLKNHESARTEGILSTQELNWIKHFYQPKKFTLENWQLFRPDATISF